VLILAMSEGRDGGIAAVEDGRLLFALEAEKDGRPRHERLTAQLLARAAARLPDVPDVVALGDSVQQTRMTGAGPDAWSRPGCRGASCASGSSDEPGTFFGRRVRLFSSAHERSHTMSAYGLAPEGQEYYAVVRERGIGAFHRVGDSGEVTHLGNVPSDAGFDRFRDHAARRLTDSLPLLVSGAGGLDGEWNRRWRDCGLFPSVFVPPCPDDSGSALGAAIDAQLYYTCSATLSWDLDAGDELVEDVEPDPARYDVRPFDAAEVAARLAAGALVAWTDGRYELGPRGLGSRCVLASPFAPHAAAVNRFRDRDPGDPVAAVCLQPDTGSWLAQPAEDPYRTFTHCVTAPELRALADDDGWARVQTVRPAANPRLAQLLAAFRAVAGVGVLGTASLREPGRGLVNRTGDLLRLAGSRGLGGCVVGDRFVTPRQVPAEG
jgi:predicted NodU family carbamoyl transferase